MHDVGGVYGRWTGRGGGGRSWRAFPLVGGGGAEGGCCVGEKKVVLVLGYYYGVVLVWIWRRWCWGTTIRSDAHRE